MRLASMLLCLGLFGACGPSIPYPQGTPPDAGPLQPPLDGGALTSLYFAVVGDTRPQNIDDTPNYPTAVIGSIYSDMAGMSPAPAFAVATGDYMYVNPAGTQAAPQMSLYLSAASQFHAPLYAAMGNHECTGYTDSDCSYTSTSNYQAFMNSLVAPLGQTTPFYAVHFHAADNTWTAKLLVTACNAWNGKQQDWFARELAEPTTYTFVVRHEDPGAPTGPCLKGGFDTLLSAAPYNILIVGHLHSYSAGGKILLVGNGGAGTAATSGYATVQLLPDAGLLTTQYDAATASPLSTFTF